ncbi:hypothetical protein ABH945_005961 [Paraburkholderia sp. GAS333]|uniref:hypothetical protein n=1 Tax=Paraburkholderia sp. GAS333 TaxID=3156279 RepID=UPI003D263C58
MPSITSDPDGVVIGIPALIVGSSSVAGSAMTPSPLLAVSPLKPGSLPSATSQPGNSEVDEATTEN